MNFNVNITIVNLSNVESEAIENCLLNDYCQEAIVYKGCGDNDTIVDVHNMNVMNALSFIRSAEYGDFTTELVVTDMTEYEYTEVITNLNDMPDYNEYIYERDNTIYVTEMNINDIVEFVKNYK